MSLIDLVTDLSNFKWTSYSDTTSAVNNIPDVNATGFTKNMKSSAYIISSIPSVETSLAYTSVTSQSNTITLSDYVPVKYGKSRIASISPRAPFNSITNDAYEINTSPKKNKITSLNIESQYTKLPRRESTVGFDQPFIVRDIGNHWGIDKAKSFRKSPLRSTINLLDNIGGMLLDNNPSVIIDRTVADITRVGKFLLTPHGIGFMAKQTLLQRLNTLPVSRGWNPLSLGSIVPFIHIQRHLSIPGYISSKINTTLLKIKDSEVSKKIKLGISNVASELSELGHPLMEKVNSILPKSSPINLKPPRNIESLKDKSQNVESLFENKESDQSKLNTYSTLAYGHLNGENSYTSQLLSPSELNSTINDKLNSGIYIDDGGLMDVRNKANIKIFKTGDHKTEGGTTIIDKYLGIIKKYDSKYITDATDIVNVHPYGNKDTDDDFISFKFKDIVNDKFIIFRAILSGIGDSIQPEWSEEKYVGRPDNVHIYQGVNRDINFSFSIYPKTKQELPVLWEKLNYLVGLCYPSWGSISTTVNSPNRMVSPFIELTIGNMFIDSPGYITSLDISVEDTTTWELDKHYQLPKFLTVSCGFKYIGKYLPNSIGKHYELDWLTDTTGTGEGTFAIDKSTGNIKSHPNRNSNVINLDELFKELGQ